MISETAQNLIAKIKAVPTLSNRAGLAAGGKSIDPTMEKVTMPAAWVIFVGDENVEPANGQESCGPRIRLSYIVKVIVDYKSEADLLTTQYPLLAEIVNAVHGKDSVVGGKKWRYDGQAIDQLTGNRLVFDQRYSVEVIY